MESGNSGSMQSSSGGEDQDHETSRSESIRGYLNSPTHFGSSDSIVHPSLLSHYQNHSHQPTATTLYDHHNLSCNNHNYDHHNLHTKLSQVPQPNTSNPNFMLNPRSNQPNSTNRIPNPPAASSTQDLLASSGVRTNTVARNSKKRTRASRRAPTTVLTTDTSNFRAMVQEFTGIPAPPFSASSSSSSPYSRRFDMFGSGMRSGHHLDTLGPLYPLRPSAHKVQQPTPFLSSSNSSSNSSSLLMMSNGTMVDATNIATTGNSNNFSSTYQLLSDHHQNQGLFPNMQNPNLTFQSLPQQPPPFHSSISMANFGARPRGVISNLAMHSFEDQLGMSHGSSYVNTNLIGGGGSIHTSHVAASEGNDGWRDRGVGSSDGRLSQDQHLRPNMDKCLEMNANSTTRGEGTVDSWICPNSD